MKTSDSIVKIIAPTKKVWLALTVPDLVKQWQYGSDLLTTWEVGTPIIFRNEWNGRVFEQKGNVLEFLPESRLKYSLFFPRPSAPNESTGGDEGPDVLSCLKELVEVKMP